MASLRNCLSSLAILRRSPPKLERGANLAEAHDAARQAATAEIVYHSSLSTDDVPLSEELDPAYVNACSALAAVLFGPPSPWIWLPKGTPGWCTLPRAEPN